MFLVSLLAVPLFWFGRDCDRYVVDRFSYMYYITSNQLILSFKVPEFEALYVQEETYDPTKYMFEHVSGPCYDHIWVSALALNCTDARLKAIGK